MPCDPGWSDLGSWQALWEQLPKDAAGNAVRGDALLDQTETCLIHAEGRLVACAGVRDLAVIETADAVLVSDRLDSDAGRRLVALLEKAGRAEATTHLEAQHPWGSWRPLQQGPGFEVEEFVIAPGARLALEAPEHRAAHWVVVAGAAKFTVNGDATTLAPGQSLDVPAGTRPVSRIRAGYPRASSRCDAPIRPARLTSHPTPRPAASLSDRVLEAARRAGPNG